jgi:hypothetical protein
MGVWARRAAFAAAAALWVGASFAFTYLMVSEFEKAVE